MKTKHSLNRPATQKDLEEWGDVFNERFENLENSFETLKKNTEEIKDKMMTYFDKIIGKLDILETENEIGTKQYRNHQVRLNNHEDRIQKLEAA